ncbi:uncharacterized protein LOC136026293 isoform X2 [Artemia franciscana]|uniref:uncharacterized protein LOC136026293 isoform X2 n=2 Tax=Artemia franciscana TaxID=6661 RepID=UPI0032DB2E43
MSRKTYLSWIEVLYLVIFVSGFFLIISADDGIINKSNEDQEGRMMKYIQPPPVSSQQATGKVNFPSQEIEEVEERSVLAPIQPLITSGINSQISTQILRIMATPASQLFVSPGGTGNIFLRVKNRGAAFSTFFFSVGANIGQNFVAVQPRQVELGIAQEIEIIVTVQVPINIYPGQNVLLTLYAIRGIDNAQTARQILIQTRNEPYDITQPYARLLTATRCSEHTFGSCATHSWAAVLEIVDTESGLRAIETRPEIAFNGEDFPIGRNSSVLVTFETTCCQRSIEIFTYDLKGNQRYDIIDQYKIDTLWLGSGEAAAISLGVILFIILIIILIIFLCRCKRKRQVQTILKTSRARDPERVDTR